MKTSKNTYFFPLCKENRGGVLPSGVGEWTFYYVFFFFFKDLNDCIKYNPLVRINYENDHLFVITSSTVLHKTTFNQYSLKVRFSFIFILMPTM